MHYDCSCLPVKKTLQSWPVTIKKKTKRRKGNSWFMSCEVERAWSIAKPCIRKEIKCLTLNKCYFCKQFRRVYLLSVLENFIPHHASHPLFLVTITILFFSDAKSWGSKESAKYYIGVSNILLGCSFAAAQVIQWAVLPGGWQVPSWNSWAHPEPAEFDPPVQNSGGKSRVHSPGSCAASHWPGEKPWGR